ncbi:MAG: HupE/UreJ family protein [Alphaproteobacteria bacterium]
MGKLAAILAALFLLAAWCMPASAHFMTGANIRVVHLATDRDGLIAFARISFALVVADGLGPQREDGTFLPAPYTTNRLIDGAAVHFVDPDAIRADPQGLAHLVADGHVLRDQNGVALAPEVLAVRLQLRGRVPPFNTLDEARAALDGPVYPDFDGAVEVSSALVDVALRYPDAGTPSLLTLEGRLLPGTLAPDATVNLIVLHDPGGASWSQQRDGLLERPVTVYEAPLRASLRFAAQGALHILEGLDHIFFVLCLVAGAGRLGGLAWRVTGFTLGHSVSLTAGYFGVGLADPWFVPAVEIGIALTIVYAGVAAMRPMQHGVGTFVVTAALGVLHGFGFSSALADLAPADAPGAAVRLAAFNVGVEGGQLAVVAVVWTALAWIGRRSADRRRRAARALATGAVWIGSVWTIERIGPLADTLWG